ncbi:MAG: hypothetical protein JWO19_4174 [Bryobacterales bacterium]|nr:hypothetical protein [Bryobacterales bacterium]
MAQPINLRQMPNGTTPAEAGPPTAAREHEDAIQSTYQVLQLLHDRGVLDLLRGLLSAGDSVVDTLVEAIDTPESIRAFRNLLLLTKFFASIQPEILNNRLQSAVDGARREESHKAPGFLELYRRLRSENSRHALAVTLDLVESVGKGL